MQNKKFQKNLVSLLSLVKLGHVCHVLWHLIIHENSYS